MTITTSFNIGDTAYTIDKSTLKLKSFTVARIIAHVTSESTTVTLYDGDTYNATGYDEQKCFTSSEALLSFITTPEQ